MKICAPPLSSKIKLLFHAHHRDPRVATHHAPPLIHSLLSSLADVPKELRLLVDAPGTPLRALAHGIASRSCPKSPTGAGSDDDSDEDRRLADERLHGVMLLVTLLDDKTRSGSDEPASVFSNEAAASQYCFCCGTQRRRNLNQPSNGIIRRGSPLRSAPPPRPPPPPSSSSSNHSKGLFGRAGPRVAALVAAVPNTCR